jgi:hypothetical protein
MSQLYPAGAGHLLPQGAGAGLATRLRRFPLFTLLCRLIYNSLLSGYNIKYK